jgi:hypothetical protein
MSMFDSLFGYRTIYDPDGKPLPERSRFRVVGAIVTDDELTKTTVISFPPSLLDSATNLPAPGTIVVRDSLGGAAFGGTVAVENLTGTGTLTWLGDFSSTGSIETAGSIEAVECKAEKFTLLRNVDETRILEVAPVCAPGDWTINADLLAVSVLPARPVAWPLRLPLGARVLYIAAMFAGAPGHAALPVFKPLISLRKVPFLGGAPSQIAAAIDPSTSLAVYQSPHLLALDLTSEGQPEVVANTIAERYMVRIDAESGANSLPGATVYAVGVIWRRLAGSTIGQD